MCIIINQREKCTFKHLVAYLGTPWGNKESSPSTSIKNTITDFIQTSKLNINVFLIPYFMYKGERISFRFLNAVLASIQRKICLYLILKRLT